MKIYEIATGYTPIPARISAATEIVVEALSDAFVQMGQAVTAVDIRTPNRQETRFPVLEVPVPRLFSGTDHSLGLAHKAKRVAYSLSLGRVLRRILRHTDKTVIFHFHNQYNLFFFLLTTPARLRKRCVMAYTTHSGIWRQDWNTLRSALRARYFQEALCMKRADPVFLLNEETKINAVNHLGVPQHRIRRVHNGVSTRKYRPLSDAEKAAAKAQFGLQNRTVILQVGSVCDNKGQLRSLQNLLPLLRSRPEVAFAYAGGITEEDYQRRIQAFAQENGIAHQVRYLGMVAPGEELNRLYNTAAATLLPSRYEAFGLVAVESLAAGVPVLLDRDSPLDFGEGCLFCRPGELSAAVDALLSSDSAPLGHAARRNALDHYSWERIAQDYLDGFQDRMLTHEKETKRHRHRHLPV